MTERNYRRIVTGHDQQGRSIVISDGTPSQVVDLGGDAGGTIVEYWRNDATPAPIARQPSEPENVGLKLLPSPGGSKFRLVEFPPGNEAALKAMPREMIEQLFAAFDAQQCLADPGDNGHPLMHRTETIDYAIVVEGEIVLVLDEEEVTMKAGDVAVQCGTAHAWANRTDEPCRMAFVLVDGKYEKGLHR